MGFAADFFAGAAFFAAARFGAAFFFALVAILATLPFLGQLAVWEVYQMAGYLSSSTEESYASLARLPASSSGMPSPSVSMADPVI